MAPHNGASAEIARVEQPNRLAGDNAATSKIGGEAGGLLNSPKGNEAVRSAQGLPSPENVHALFGILSLTGGQEQNKSVIGILEKDSQRLPESRNGYTQEGEHPHFAKSGSHADGNDNSDHGEKGSDKQLAMHINSDADKQIINAKSDNLLTANVARNKVDVGQAFMLKAALRPAVKASSTERSQLRADQATSKPDHPKTEESLKHVEAVNKGHHPKAETKPEVLRSEQPKTTKQSGDKNSKVNKAHESKVTEPKGHELKATEPKATEPKGHELKTTEPKTTESKGHELKTTEPKASESKGHELKTTEPKTTESKGHELKTTEPKASESKGREFKTTEPKASESKGHEFKTTEPKTTEAKGREFKTTEPKATEPKGHELKTTEPKVTEPKGREFKTTEPKTSESKGHELKTTEPKASPTETTKSYTAESSQTHPTETTKSHTPETSQTHPTETTKSHIPETSQTHPTETTKLHPAETSQTYPTDIAKSYAAETNQTHPTEIAKSHTSETSQTHPTESSQAHQSEIAKNIEVVDKAHKDATVHNSNRAEEVGNKNQSEKEQPNIVTRADREPISAKQEQPTANRAERIAATDNSQLSAKSIIESRNDAQPITNSKGELEISKVLGDKLLGCNNEKGDSNAVRIGNNNGIKADSVDTKVNEIHSLSDGQKVVVNSQLERINNVGAELHNLENNIVRRNEKFDEREEAQIQQSRSIARNDEDDDDRLSLVEHSQLQSFLNSLAGGAVAPLIQVADFAQQVVNSPMQVPQIDFGRSTTATNTEVNVSHFVHHFTHIPGERSSDTVRGGFYADEINNRANTSHGATSPSLAHSTSDHANQTHSGTSHTGSTTHGGKQGHDPKGKGHDPSGHAHGPGGIGHGSAGQGHDPKTKTHDPAVQGHDPKTKTHDPAVHGHGLTGAGHDPAGNGHDPSAQGQNATGQGHNPSNQSNDPANNQSGQTGSQDPQVNLGTGTSLLGIGNNQSGPANGNNTALVVDQSQALIHTQTSGELAGENNGQTVSSGPYSNQSPMLETPTEGNFVPADKGLSPSVVSDNSSNGQLTGQLGQDTNLPPSQLLDNSIDYWIANANTGMGQNWPTTVSDPLPTDNSTSIGQADNILPNHDQLISPTEHNPDVKHNTDQNQDKSRTEVYNPWSYDDDNKNHNLQDQKDAQQIEELKHRLELITNGMWQEPNANKNGNKKPENKESTNNSGRKQPVKNDRLMGQIMTLLNDLSKGKKAKQVNRTYIVKAGDTLESIATEVLFDIKLALLLYLINQMTLIKQAGMEWKQSKLQEGMTLYLPGEEEINAFRLAMPRGVGQGRAHLPTDIPDSQWQFDKQYMQGMNERRQNVERLLGSLASSVDAKYDPETGRQRIVVRLGDTLRSIALKILNDVSLWKLLAKCNNLSTEVDSKGAPVAVLIRGMVLQLPGEEEMAACRASQAAITRASSPRKAIAAEVLSV